MSTRPQDIEIGLLIYPQCQLAAIYGLTDLFRVANRLRVQLTSGDTRQLQVSHWALNPDNQRVERVFDTNNRQKRALTVLILPPSLDTEPGGDAVASHVRWLTAQHAAGTMICSVCAGAFLLAESGLLNGRSATTHWIHTEALARRFPEVRIDTDKLIIDEGDIVTAGGVMAWVDLGLKLIERFLSPTIMLSTARYLLVDAGGRQQRFYSSFAPRMGHGDKCVLKVQHWLHKHSSESIAIPAMAARVNLGVRTFLRRFHKATGMTPSQYVQQLRVLKARESLEFSRLTINEIAWTVGYEDAGSFRRIFRGVVGLSPMDYRRRFGVGVDR
jgi:transcriptional regulator GlxA family with amidase domain